MESRENSDLIKLKSFKVMKRKLFMACAALVVSAAAVVGVKAYNYSQMSDLALANIEALTRDESNKKEGSLWATAPNSEGVMRYCCGPGDARNCNDIPEIQRCPYYVQ